jgi:hypothetical protein
MGTIFRKFSRTKIEKFCDFVEFKFKETQFNRTELFQAVYNYLTYNDEENFKEFLKEKTGKSLHEIIGML